MAESRTADRSTSVNDTELEQVSQEDDIVAGSRSQSAADCTALAQDCEAWLCIVQSMISK